MFRQIYRQSCQVSALKGWKNLDLDQKPNTFLHLKKKSSINNRIHHYQMFSSKEGIWIFTTECLVGKNALFILSHQHFVVNHVLKWPTRQIDIIHFKKIKPPPLILRFFSCSFYAINLNWVTFIWKQLKCIFMSCVRYISTPVRSPHPDIRFNKTIKT